MRHSMWLTGIALLLAGSAVADGVQEGQQVFERQCAACHGAGPHHAGTAKLQVVRGPDRAVLAERTDLIGDYIRIVVRRGLIEMPPWRKTELSDEDLDHLVAYLTRPRDPSAR
mgnify:FL=1